jgi:hypothetical protein
MLLLYAVSSLRLDFVNQFGHPYNDNIIAWINSDIIFEHTIMLDLSLSPYMRADMISVVAEICQLGLQGLTTS